MGQVASRRQGQNPEDNLVDGAFNRRSIFNRQIFSQNKKSKSSSHDGFSDPNDIPTYITSISRTHPYELEIKHLRKDIKDIDKIFRDRKKLHKPQHKTLTIGHWTQLLDSADYEQQSTIFRSCRLKDRNHRIDINRAATDSVLITRSVQTRLNISTLPNNVGSDSFAIFREGDLDRFFNYEHTWKPMLFTTPSNAIQNANRTIFEKRIQTLARSIGWFIQYSAGSNSPHLQPNLYFQEEMVVCQVCCDLQPRWKTILLECGHIHCKDCLMRNVRTSFYSSNASSIARCCGPLNLIVTSISANDDEELELLTRYMIYQKKFTRAVDCYKCRRELQATPTTSKTNYAYCTNCQTPTCMLCSKHDHSIMCRKGFTNILTLKTIDTIIRKGWAQCPRCRMIIEKREGCNNIRCNCGKQFCYNCGKTLMSGRFCTCKDSKNARKRMKFQFEGGNRDELIAGDLYNLRTEAFTDGLLVSYVIDCLKIVRMLKQHEGRVAREIEYLRKRLHDMSPV